MPQPTQVDTIYLPNRARKAAPTVQSRRSPESGILSHGTSVRGMLLS